MIAKQVGHLTRLSSLELSCDAVRKSGACDSGYACAYQFNLAWASPNTPLTPEVNPRLLFERLFGAGKPGERAKGGTVTLSIDGDVVGTGTIPRTQPNTFSLDDTADTGVDTGTAVDEAYGEGERNAFDGTLVKVTVDVK